MKKWIFIAVILAVAGAAVVSKFNITFDDVVTSSKLTFSEVGKRTKIIVAKMKITTTDDGTVLIRIPMAALPRSLQTKYEAYVDGKVIELPNINVTSAPKVVSLLHNSEPVIVSNVLYAHTLQAMYMGRNVRLSGKWGKDTVISGASYKTFWVEDVDLKE